MNAELAEYKTDTLSNLINSIKEYKKGRKKQKLLNEQPVKVYYNHDMENLVYCIEPLEQLNELIGMDKIKKNIIDQVLFYAQRLNTNEMMHTCLTGPPGVGKTTLGKILAELLVIQNSIFYPIYFMLVALRIAQMRENQLPVSEARWQHGSQICFATFV